MSKAVSKAMNDLTFREAKQLAVFFSTYALPAGRVQPPFCSLASEASENMDIFRAGYEELLRIRLDVASDAEDKKAAA